MEAAKAVLEHLLRDGFQSMQDVPVRALGQALRALVLEKAEAHKPSDPVSEAFESLNALPLNEAAFLRHLLMCSIIDPELAQCPTLTVHLMQVPEVLRILPTSLIRRIPDYPHTAEWARLAVKNRAGTIAEGAKGLSHVLLTKLCHVALRDPQFLAHYLSNGPISEFYADADHDIPR